MHREVRNTRLKQPIFTPVGGTPTGGALANLTPGIRRQGTCKGGGGGSAPGKGEGRHREGGGSAPGRGRVGAGEGGGSVLGRGSPPLRNINVYKNGSLRALRHATAHKQIAAMEASGGREGWLSWRDVRRWYAIWAPPQTMRRAPAVPQTRAEAAVFFFLKIRFRGGLGFRGMVS
eukprot:COSAG02_NODE_3407_length_6793_cov_3.608157_2_plen_175_part_00